jgi:hypothetical protein
MIDAPADPESPPEGRSHEPQRILVPVIQAPRSAFQAGFYGALGAMAAVAFMTLFIGGAVAIMLAITAHPTTTTQGLQPGTPAATHH